jgi:hypothetical protein
MQMAFRSKFHAAVLGATACTALLAGCGGSSGYFMVRDPGTPTPYYTENIDTAGSAVKFKDERTGSDVTLQSSEVKKISKEEFMKGMTAPAAAPVAAPAPAAAIVAPAPTVGAQTPAAAAPAAAGASVPATVPAAAAAPGAKPQ